MTDKIYDKEIDSFRPVVPNVFFEPENLFRKFDFNIDKEYIFNYHKTHIHDYDVINVRQGKIYGLKVNNIDYFEEIETNFLNYFNIIGHTFDKGLMHYDIGKGINPHLDRPYSQSSCVIMFPIQAPTPMIFHEYVGNEPDMIVVHRTDLWVNNIGMELSVPMDKPMVVNTDVLHSAISDDTVRILMKWNVKTLEFCDLVEIMKTKHERLSSNVRVNPFFKEFTG